MRRKLLWLGVLVAALVCALPSMAARSATDDPGSVEPVTYCLWRYCVPVPGGLKCVCLVSINATNNPLRPLGQVLNGCNCPDK